jgi:hypothetical protein
MFVAPDPHRWLGQSVGSGHCVALVQLACAAPHTSAWKPGAKARGGALPRGAAIATFQNGAYQNRTNGDSHAAIFLEEVPGGLRVVDQWKGSPCAERTIRFKGGQGTANNDADQFYAVTS